MERSAQSARKLLVIGDEDTLRGVLRGVFSSLDFSVEEADCASEGLALLRAGRHDLVLSDLTLPGLGGLHLLAAAREVDPTVGFILFAERSRLAEAIDGLRSGADDYILKPFDPDEVRHAVHRTLHHRQAVLDCRAQQARLEAITATRQAGDAERVFLEALLAIANAVEARDGYNGEHVVRVTKYAVAVARRMGLPSNRLRNLWIGSLLHDVGKIGIPEEILRKPARLTPEEDEVMRRHPVIGAAIIERSELLRPAAAVVRHRHERWDGSGYPAGLAGEQIPLEGRILGVAEAYDALVTERPYRPRRSRSEAIVELRRCAGAQFDARVVDAFIASLDTAEFEEVELVHPPEPE